MTKSSFYRFGQKAGVTYRRARWMWESVAGSEDDAIKAEYGVGRDMAAVVREQTPCEPHAETLALLDGIREQLAGSVRNPLHRFDVAVVGEDQPTAFALPGGFIFVAPRLVQLCQRDRDELAFVVAHEMSHVIRRHAIDRLLSQKVLSAASLASPGRGMLAPWIRKVGLQWLERAYSREQEFEADELGAMLMRAAGFHPGGSVRLLHRFRGLDAASHQTGLGAYLSTHPPVAERISKLRQRFDLAG
jgi:predicted Zn-dependent protease